MAKLIINKVDDNLEEVLNDYGFSIMSDLEKLNLTPDELTLLIKEYQDHIELNRKAIIYQIEKILINKNRIPYNNLGKSNAIRLYAIIDRTFDMSIIPIRAYSAKKKPKNANKEEKRMKDIMDDYYEFRKSGGN